MTHIDSYILVGGRSRRLGQNKAVVDLGGHTLAERAIQTVSSALPESEVSFVAANEAQFAIEAIIAGGRFIFDLMEGRGPLGGLHAALSDTKAPWIFVMACDYPFVSTKLITTLADRISDDYGVVVPEQADGRLQPLCAFYRTETAGPVVEQIIDRPRVPPPLHEIVKELKPCIVTASEFADLDGSDRFFVNVNTDLDLDRAREIERKLSAEK
jgi:molybdopterin-guanine dinucleotide biosynthesis protein A